MVRWNYDPNNVATSFELIPEGIHRVRIAKADDEKPTRKTGEPMITLTLDVSGYNGTLGFWIPFLSANPGITNARLKEVAEGFGCQVDDGQGGVPFKSWLGKIGVVEVEHVPQQKDPNKMAAQIKRVLSFAEARELSLPNWQEPGQPKVPARAANAPAPGPMPMGQTVYPAAPGSMPQSYRNAMPNAAGQGYNI